jgi:hypothetical protein
MRATWIILALTTGCLRQTEFRCDTNAQCGTGGTCETVGYCSFSDPDCGRRFGPQAGTLANTCVGGADAGVDSARVDAMIDGSSNHCSAGYNPITNGTPGHRYKLIPNADHWQQQVDLCAGAFTYLAIPDDPTELGALDTLAGAISEYWVGIDDMATEGTFVTIKGPVATYLPWQPPAPDNQAPGENCVEVLTAAAMFNDDRCTPTSHAAICECDP